MKKQTIYSFSLILAFIFIIMVFAIPTHTLATDQTEEHHFNRNMTLVFIPHEDFGDTTISDFNEALYCWNSKVNTTLLRREPTVRHEDTGYPNDDGLPKIYREDRPSIVFPGKTEPYTVTTYAKTNSENTYTYKKVITSADILLNTHFHLVNSTTPASGHHDVWTVFVHEAGHVLGLAHPTNSNLNSVMEAFPNGGVARRYPSTSDGNKLNSWLVTLP